MTVILKINKSNLYINNNYIQYINNEIWTIPYIYIIINNKPYTFSNVIFNINYNTNNNNQFNLINKYKGYTLPKLYSSWYTNCLDDSGEEQASFQLIWGQDDIPQEYYSICGFAGTTNVQAQNPFTNSNGPYYGTYITSNNNYASNSGWIIILAGTYDPTLVNPPYLEDV
jgi:hypothetical protein